MYLQYFGLNEPPFSITPDPRFVYLSPRHEDALAHLQYGIGQGGSGGFVQLTGEVGTGKTTLCRTLLEQLPDNTRLALILNPALGPLELLQTICQEFRIDTTDAATDSIKQLVDLLNAFLLQTHADGHSAVLLIDEAQNLSPESLEQIRLLTNLETATKKLLQIILLGQPELRDVLARPDLRQLAQRVTARYHLRPLNAAETAIYVDHRLMVAGCPDSPFVSSGHRALHRYSDGVPRLINIIAERALLSAYAGGKREIGAKLVRAAAREVRGDEPTTSAWPKFSAIAATIVVGITGLSWWWQQRPLPEPIDQANAAPVTSAIDNDQAATHIATQEQTRAQTGTQTELQNQNPMQSQPNPTQTSSPAAVPPWPASRVLNEARPFAQAWASLLARRSLSWFALGNPLNCRAGVAPGVSCFTQRGGLDEITRLGRPLLLAVPAGNGFIVAQVKGEHSMLWTGETPNQVAGQVTDQTADEAEAQVSNQAGVPIATAELARYWDGRYWDVWAMPGYVPNLLREGDRGPGVLWLKSVATAVGYAGDTADPYFGPALTSWAIEFQRQVGVKADGLVGPQTLQHVTAALAQNAAHRAAQSAAFADENS